VAQALTVILELEQLIMTQRVIRQGAGSAKNLDSTVYDATSSSVCALGTARRVEISFR
jgi:hypothetical protein